MAPDAGPPPAPHRGDRMLRVGVVLTVVGLAFTLVAMVPLVVPSVRLPGVFWFLAMLTGVGLAVILLGLWRAARARGRAVTAAVEGPPPAR